MTDPQGRAGAVAAFLRNGWLPDLVFVSFLAAGEYNENWLAETPRGCFVLRINHGSQLGLADQIMYESRVLQALAASGVTPRTHFCDPEAPGLGGVLLMDWLPGRPLEYGRDDLLAAQIFTRIHAQAPDRELVAQPRPIRAIAEESLGLLTRFPDHALRAERDRLLAYRDEVLRLAEEFDPLCAAEAQVIANTEVNSGNFLVDDASGRGFLVDWEKAVVTCRWQDLGHFLSPSTTLWKADHLYDAAGRREFVAAYLAASGLDLDLHEAVRRTGALIRAVLLRGLSWCHMAFHEYTRSGRPLRNVQTFARIRLYLERLEWFLS